MRAFLFSVLALAAFAPGVRAGDRPAPLRTGLRPVSLGRAATLPPVTTDRAAGLKTVTRDRAALLRPVTRKRAAGLHPATKGLRAATADRAAAPAPVSLGRTGLAPATGDRAAGLAPVTTDRAAGLSSVSLGRTSGLLPVTTGRAAELPPVTIDREALLRAVGYDGAEASVIAFRDGVLAPYRRWDRETEGRLSRLIRCRDGETFGSREHRARVSEAFRRAGYAAPAILSGSYADALSVLDPYGPHRRGRRPLGRNVPAGVTDGRFYYPAAFFLRPVARGDGAYNKGWGAIIVDRDVTEEVPEDFDRTLRKSSFPLVIGDMAFKNGDYVQAAIAFREGASRRPDAAAAHFALSDALVALGNYGYAVSEIRAGLSLAPGWADRLDRRGVYGVPEDLGRHIAALEAWLSGHATSAAGRFLLGYLRMTSGSAELRASAAEAFRAALERDPDDADSARFLRRLDEEIRPR